MKKRVTGLLTLFLSGIFCILISSVIAKAADQEILFVQDLENAEKVTKQLKNSTLVIEASDSRAAITITTEDGNDYVSEFLPLSGIVIRENHKIYFVRQTKKIPEIIQFNTDTAEETVLKRFTKKHYSKKGEPVNLILEHTDSKHLYYSLRDPSSVNEIGFASFDVYRIETTQLKSNLVAKAADRIKFVKNRMVYFDALSDFGPMRPHSVLLNGKEKKTLNQWVLMLQVINDKIYFVGSKDQKDFYVYRANSDFSKIEKLSKKIKTKKGHNLQIAKITDKKVYYESYDLAHEMPNYYFVIDLKTKAVKKMKGNIWEIN